MKYFFHLILALLTLGSCQRSQDERSKILKVYNWADYIDEDVLAEFPEWYKEHSWDIVDALRDFKVDFCWAHDLHWGYECWFCQYVRSECGRCPLQSCDHKNPLTAWARIVDEDTSLETKLQAVDNIIAALKGERK
jgi:hypothetical protein